MCGIGVNGDDGWMAGWMGGNVVFCLFDTCLLDFGIWSWCLGFLFGCLIWILNVQCTVYRLRFILNEIRGFKSF